MDEEKYLKAKELQENISKTESDLRICNTCNAQKERGIKICLQDSEILYFDMPKESTDIILKMSLEILENKLNRLKEEFEAL